MVSIIQIAEKMSVTFLFLLEDKLCLILGQFRHSFILEVRFKI